jgi:hypothetical protein
VISALQRSDGITPHELASLSIAALLIVRAIPREAAFPSPCTASLMMRMTLRSIISPPHRIIVSVQGWPESLHSSAFACQKKSQSEAFLSSLMAKLDTIV